MQPSLPRPRTLSFHAALILLTAFATSACLADLRPAGLLARTSATDAGQARSILNAGAAAQSLEGQSRATWLAMSGVRVRVTDTWEALPNLLANNWPANPVHFEMKYLPGDDASVVHFLDAAGKATGQSWGIHEWHPWSRTDTGAQAVYANDGAIKFNLPTVQYFLEMAMRLPDGGIVDYAGIETQSDGTECHVVYITWENYAATDMIDQYVAYYDTQSGRLHHVDFTVRDSQPFVTAAAYYRDYRTVQGFYVPFRIDITEVGAPEEFIHVYEIKEVELNYPLPRAEYAPDANRAPAAKY